MIIYNHNTPEKLISKFYSVEQLREFPVCELAKDVPTDLLTTNNFTIIEREDTMNLDLSLAILYNNITDLESAIQFARIFIINGPRIDTKTIIFYVDRINNGPFGPQIGDFVSRHFQYASGGRKIPNTGRDAVTSSDIYEYDQNFTNQLIDALKDCLYAPCNYFNYGGGMGLFGNADQIPTVNSLPPGDLTNDIGPPGTISKSLFTKLLPTIQTNILAFNQSIITLGKNIKSSLFTTKEKREQDRAFKAGNSAYNPANAGQVVVSGRTLPDYTTYFAFQKAQLGTQAVTMNALGDCGRINNYFRNFNPYDPEQSLDNQNNYYNPFSLTYPERTNASLGTQKTAVVNNETQGEIDIVNYDGSITTTSTEDGFVILDVNVKTSVYGYLKEFGSSQDDKYVGVTNGEPSWDKVFSKLKDSNTWMGSTALGESVSRIEVEKYKQTISAKSIKIPTTSGSIINTNYIRTSNGPVSFRPYHCALSPELGTFLGERFGIKRGEWITILIKDNNGIKSNINLKWVDTTARGLTPLRVDIFVPQYQPIFDGKKVIGIKRLKQGHAEEINSKTKSVNDNILKQNNGETTLPVNPTELGNTTTSNTGGGPNLPTTPQTEPIGINPLLPPVN